jgi:hypothetical protein
MSRFECRYVYSHFPLIGILTLIQGPGGGKPRRDTYLYGHPKGPRKRFRSPMDFAPHVKWLSFDKTKNPANCGCNACKGGPPPGASPPAMPTPVPTVPPQVMPAATRIVPAGVPATAGPTVPSPPTTTRRQAVPATVRAPAVIQSPVPAPTPSFSPVPTQQQQSLLEAYLLASATNAEREHDLRFPGLSIYRLGEQVWFQTGPHWALGVVLEIPPPPNSTYKIHPLHSPLICEQTLPHTEIKAIDLRPWVAWSTPPVTNPNLSTDNRIEYENLPWQQERGSGSIEVDASILKSRDVDVSFTLIDKLTPQNHYAGVYHGAEKLWVGDAVRLKATSCPTYSTGREIMVITSIQDFMPNNPHGTRLRETGVTLTGDIFRLTNHTQSIPAPPGLPNTVQADLTLRGKFAIPNPTCPYWSYALVARSFSVKLEDIKGRWYPGSSLFRIMHGINRFSQLAETQSISHQEWDEIGSKMNEMGTGGNGSVLGYRRYEHRHQAFLKAIPQNVVFNDVGHAVNIANNMQTMHLQQQQTTLPPISNVNPHTINAAAGVSNEPIDLTGDDNDAGMEFLADHDSADEEFIKQIREDAASFLHNDDDFYGGL